jgi:hypothetical protein
MQTTTSDLGEALACSGMTLAASHADREVENWTEQAAQLFSLYAAMHPEGFLTEDVRLWASKLGFPPPPDGRAWGYIARKAAVAGRIKSMGYAKAKSSNNSPKVLWTCGEAA